MRLKQTTFYKRFGVRHREELNRPRLAPIETLELPYPVIYHFNPNDSVTIGPTAEDPIIATFDSRIFIEHVTQLKSNIGNPRRTAVNPMLIENEFRRSTRGFKPLRRDDALTLNPRNGLVVNYGMLTPIYRYFVSWQRAYYEWRNVQETVWKTVSELHTRFAWEQYITIDIPETFPTREEMVKLNSSRSETSLKPFTQSESLTLFDLWQWIGVDRDKSAMSLLDTESLDNINLLFKVKQYFFVLNLGRLNSFRKSEESDKGLDPGLLQMRLSSLFHGLRDVIDGTTVPDEVQDDSGEDENLGTFEDQLLPPVPIMRLPEPISPPEAPRPLIFDEEENIPRFDTDAEESDDVGKRYTKQIEQEVDHLAESGLLTVKAKERTVKEASRFTELKDPFGSGKTLAEAMSTSDADYALPTSRPLPDRKTIPDKSMLESKIQGFHRKYVDNLMPKHIMQSVMSVQNLGLMVKDYKVETVMDSMNHYNIHTVVVKPVKGRQSTLRFRTPVIDKDGRFVSNGKANRMRLQRAD